MASKTKVVLGRGQGSMPIDTKPLPEPKAKRQPQGYGDMKAPPMGNHMDDSAPASPGRSFFGGGRDEMGSDYGPPVERMPPSMRGMPMPVGGGRGVFMDARINPDGSHQGRNSDNEFDEWMGGRMLPRDIGPGSANERARQVLRDEFERSRGGGSMGDAQYREPPYGDSSALIDGWLQGGGMGGAMDARESMLGLDNPRRITRPPLAPSPRSGGKPPQKPVRKFKKKRLMPRKPRPTNKLGGE